MALEPVKIPAAYDRISGTWSGVRAWLREIVETAERGQSFMYPDPQIRTTVTSIARRLRVVGVTTTTRRTNHLGVVAGPERVWLYATKD